MANLARAADVMAGIALCWLLALPAAVFLRGWKASSARRVLMAAGLMLGWLALGALLVAVGVNHRGLHLLCLVVISGLVLLPAIRWAWRDRDLADFIPQRAPQPEDAP